MRIHFQASPAEAAHRAFRELAGHYGQVKTPHRADVIVALGGDGETLHALQAGLKYDKPVFGLNFGHVGFLQNLHKTEDDLVERIGKAEVIRLNPLLVRVASMQGGVKKAFAINEAFIRNIDGGRGLYLRVLVDDQERVPRLGADGIIVATTIGSSAYNRSARGPALPLGNDLLAFTPVNAFTPDRMRASVIRPHALRIEVLEPGFRPAEVYVDGKRIARNVKTMAVDLDREHSYQLLFDPGYSLHEKVMRTQFSAPGPE